MTNWQERMKTNQNIITTETETLKRMMVIMSFKTFNMLSDSDRDLKAECNNLSCSLFYILNQSNALSKYKAIKTMGPIEEAVKLYCQDDGVFSL